MRKVSRGASFRGVIAYAFADKHSKFLGASKCVMATTQNGLVREFGAAHFLRPGCKKPVWHQALRLPPGEIVSHEKQLGIAHEYMLRMGFDPEIHQYVVIAHGDDHVHIIARRVGLDGTLWLGKNENLVSTRVVAGLERSFGLQITKGPEYVETFTPGGEIKYHIKPAASSDQAKLKRASRKEEMRHARLSATGQAPAQSPRQRIVAVLTEARQVGKKEGLAGFLRTAESRGVEVRTILGVRMSQRELVAAAIAVSGAIADALAGIVFRALGREFSGSRLGAGFAAPKLSAELRIGESKHDAELLIERQQPFGDARQITPIPPPTAPRKGRSNGYKPTFPAARGHANVSPERAVAPGARRTAGAIRSINGVRPLSGLDVVRNSSPDGGKQARVAPDLLLPSDERQHVVGGRETPADRLRRAAHAAPAAGVRSPGLRGSVLGPVDVDREPAAMTYHGNPNPSLGGGPLGRKVLEPVVETPAPPPPPPPVMRPQFEVQYEAEVRRAHETGKRIYGDDYLTRDNVRATLDAARAKRDLAEDAAFPGRRQRREKSDAAIKARAEAAFAHQANFAKARFDPDGYYLEAAAGWIAAYRAEHGKAAVPKPDEWREFDRSEGVRALMKGHIIPDKVAPALTKLSGGAVRSSDALEQQAKDGKAFDLVIDAYGDDRLRQVKADIAKAERVATEAAAAGLKSNPGNRRKGPRA